MERRVSVFLRRRRTNWGWKPATLLMSTTAPPSSAVINGLERCEITSNLELTTQQMIPAELEEDKVRPQIGAEDLVVRSLRLVKRHS